LRMRRDGKQQRENEYRCRTERQHCETSEHDFESPLGRPVASR
jgi:hypothetical protein